MAGVSAYALSTSGGGASPPRAERAAPEAEDAWTDGLFTAFKPLADELVRMLESRRSWVEGTATAAEFATAVERVLPAFVKARDDVVALRPAAPSERIGDLYTQAARLYLESLRAYRVAVDVPLALGTELDRFANRLRVLADRIYDRARAAADPGRAEVSGDETEYRPVAEVPDWVAEGLAAGPPLADAPPPAPEVPPGRQATRRTQPERDWISSVGGAEIPPAEALGTALRAGDVAALRALATEFTAVVGRLAAEPDPRNGGRERSALLSLGLLVHGEAARAGQGAGIVGDAALASRLTEIGRRLALIGDGLWDPAFEGRVSGFDAALLDEGSL